MGDVIQARVLRVRPDGVLRHLVALEKPKLLAYEPEQLSLFDGGNAV